MLILVLNSGSSSLKYQLRDTDGDAILIDSEVDRIGDSDVADHAAALDQVEAALTDVLQGRQINAVGHRVVHGGERFHEPVLITSDVVHSIERLNPLAPLHNPANVLGIRSITDKWPDLPQVAVFDTSFHGSLPERAWRYALPDEL